MFVEEALKVTPVVSSRAIFYVSNLVNVNYLGGAQLWRSFRYDSCFQFYGRRCGRLKSATNEVCIWVESVLQTFAMTTVHIIFKISIHLTGVAQ
jgi:hypothetical protein